MRVLILILAICLASAKPTNKKARPDLFKSSNNPIALSDDEFIVEGDIRAKKNDKRFKSDDGARGLVETSDFYRWPQNTIPYEFASNTGYSDAKKQLVVESLALLNQKSGDCVKFRPKTDSDADYVQIVNGGGCSSYVGRMGERQVITLANDDFCLSKSTIIHEFMHALGVWHELSRPDRDNYVTVIYKNIQGKYRKNFDKRYGKSYYGSEYSYGSVMHYSAYAASKNGEKVIVAPDGIVLEYTNIDDDILSTADIKSLRGYYECTDPTP